MKSFLTFMENKIYLNNHDHETRVERMNQYSISHFCQNDYIFHGEAAVVVAVAAS